MALGYGRTGTNNFAMVKFIVDSNGLQTGATHTTIQGAIDDASSGDMIGIRYGSTGSYAEDPVLIDGITLVALTDRLSTKPEILGQCSITSGTANIKGLQLTEDGSAAIACSSTGGVNIYNCALTCSTADLITNSGSGLIRVLESSVNLLGNFKAFDCSGSGGIFFRNCSGANTASTTASTHSGSGTLRVEQCNIPIHFSMSGSSGTIISNSTLDGETRNITILTTAGTGNHSIHNCNIKSGTSSCVSVGSGTTFTTANTNYESSNTNVITGAGTVKPSNLSFSGSSSLINTTTQTELNEVHGPISFDGGTNFLDAYEEGTWTPVLGAISGDPTVTYTVQAGKYTKVGNLVFVKWQITINTISGGTGTSRIRGLPFTVINETAQPRLILSTSRVAYPTSALTLIQSVVGNDTIIQMNGELNNASGVGLDISNFANGDFLTGTIFYWI